MTGVGAMAIAQAQRDVRETFVGGFFGQLVSGALWLASAATATWASETAAMVVLCLGGTLVYPLTTACLWLSGRPASLPAGHPLASLAMQVAFTVPPGLLVALAAASGERDWFFPASMVIVGCHYLPFVFLYGMRLFAALAGILVFSGVILGVMVADPFSVGGWFAGALLVAFAFVLRRHAGDDHERSHTGGVRGEGRRLVLR